ncbi:amine oxidase [Methylocella silvestris BL2]|uniref:Amine oxidase n=1 Tax=Methylocella silvestris (strain DSM 15510 / CIP 108128 / LMG 27833 / NCIMB 13906 / BL2) TaxID=395965 RepID=B8EKE3_METSB|nr:FAD-dependent oxidoreductase [Methylocella silvestris]ACK50683.1 amine oxidase [Methylocella silvestris BL2]
MLETAIIGGGLCGLALAAELEAAGRDYCVFEARSRLGGRVLSEQSEKAAMRVDLGPTWFWPETQPRITKLVADLGLAHFAQHDEGAVLRLVDFDKRAERSEGESVHAGARRIAGGTASLIEALAAKIPADRIQLGHVVTAIKDCGDHIKLTVRAGEAETIVEARRVVLALPPRLVEQSIVFEPALDHHLVDALRETATWMAAEAKAVTVYDRSLWREAGASGNAYVTHQDAVFYEIFDACDAAGTGAALGAFLALTPALRESFAVGLPMLMGNQIAQIFGPELEQGELHYQDWAAEAFTCAASDLAPLAERPLYDNPYLRQAAWGGRLLFGGSETAGAAGGYMEGAVEAAQRLLRDITRFAPAKENGMANEVALAAFGQWTAERQSHILAAYRTHLNRLLASSDKEFVTQRAMLATMEEVFADALAKLGELPFDMDGVAIAAGRSDLTPKILQNFDGFLQTLLDCVVKFNRTSCALSNFPGEDKLAKDYVQAILLDLAAAWREFCLSANAIFVARTEAAAA